MISMPSPNPKYLRQILLKTSRGDERSFEALYTMFSDRIFFLARAYFFSREEAEEVVQEVFVKIWMCRTQLDPKKSFQAYVKKIANNILINKLKRKAVEKRFQQYFLHHQLEGLNVTQQEVEFHELQRNIELGIRSLPPKRKEIFRLSREKGLSNKEISVKLGISKRTVDDHLAKSLQFLRKQLALISATGKTAIMLLLLLFR